MILIITNKEDAHPTPVLEILNKNNVPVFRLNTEALLTDYQFCWRNDSKSCDFYIKNIHNNLEIYGSKIKAVWDRRPANPAELPIKIDEEIDKYNLKEALGFMRFLRFYIKDIFSIGSIVNDRTASSKMLQTKIAQELGFLVPDTCFSNVKKDIVNFVQNYDDVILKNIGGDDIFYEEKDLYYAFYSKKVKSADIVKVPEKSFIQSANYIQNYIEKLYELRITVVCDKVFACKIDSQFLDEDTGKIDWRQGYDYGLKHSVYDLPKDIENKCLLFLQQMGLNFGCFDFIVTPGGEYVFLECNPNGQWLWIEEETGMKISEAIAKALNNNNAAPD